jgi:hypothetical protein
MQPTLSTNRSYGHSQLSQMAATRLRQLGVTTIFKALWDQTERWAKRHDGQITAADMASHYLVVLSCHALDAEHCTEAYQCGNSPTGTRGD